MLKKQFDSEKVKKEGIVRASERGFGFLEVANDKTSYFIPPQAMKNVLNGDRVIAIITEEEEKIVLPQLSQCCSGRWYPDFADITARDTDKGKGLRAVMAWKGLKREETMAFGDGGNDIPIIREAGIGVAMGNANESLKAVADYVTSSVEEDGISQALKHWVLDAASI